MTLERREFLRLGAAAGSVAVSGGCAAVRLGGRAIEPDPGLLDLARAALESAEAGGAVYADIRICDYRRQRINTRDRRVTDLLDSEDRGFGVRVLVDGTWGFAASPRIEKEEMLTVARRAVMLARTNAELQLEPVQLAPTVAYTAVWNTPLRTDPFDVSLDDKIERLLWINAEALRQRGVTLCLSSVDFVREHKFFASTDGAVIEQTLHRNNPSFTVTAVDRRRGTFESRNAYSSPQGRGYEYFEDYPWREDVRLAASDVQEKAAAPSVAPGKYDLILHPSHLWLTIHESIGHPTEYDRAVGMEANFAGTSFLTPDKLGSFQVASPIVHFQAEKTAIGSLATCGYDDDGVATQEWPLVTNGVFVDYQTTRDQALCLGRAASFGCCYAQSWRDVAFQRMPNINLLPGDNSLSLDEMIADTEEAILIKGRGSYSIDHQRYNFQFGGQTSYHVKHGKIVGMLKDVAYQARTPDFWRSCDAICGPKEYWVGGSFYDGKGEPRQSNAVSHGCSPARFRRVDVLNTERKV
ncbi:MAG: TldD protein [Planctomycetes bacterium]|jgi:TldD protein|nr:TldD protein [Planctomycetota bacterium]